MNRGRSIFALAVAALVIFATPLVSVGSAGGISGAIQTTNKDGTAVNQNAYASLEDVYLSRRTTEPESRRPAGRHLLLPGHQPERLEAALA